MPRKIDVTPGKNAGENDERNVLRTDLRSDCCYVMDRWYAQYRLFNQIESIGAGYVCRVKDNVRYEAYEPQPLSEEAVEAGVLSDEITKMGSRGKPHQRADHPVRLVRVRATPRTKTGSRKGGPSSDGVLRIATNLTGPPPEIIAETYRQRWSIKVFFKFFKHVLGCRHLIAQDENGIKIQVDCAIIACLLLSLWTGRKPTLRTYEMVGFFFTGLADEQELLEHLAKLKPHAE